MLSLKVVRDRLKICKEKCKYFCRHGHHYRRKHLKNRLAAAQERHDKEAETKILAIIQRENDRSYWHRLNYSVSKPRGRSIKVVQTSTLDGLVTEYDTQRSVQETIWKGIHNK